MLTTAERMKFEILSTGISITPAAQEYINAGNRGRAMTPADYASTSGVILELEDDVWVNAPIGLYNSNFVQEPSHVLDVEEAALVVRGRDVQSAARFWLPPDYHDESDDMGDPFTSYAFTHSDRVRISPIEGCAVACKFCNLPYEFRYRRKSVDGLAGSVARALADETQPAYHVLISGGTPHDEDFGYVREVYESVITRFAGIDVDIMMVPLAGLLDAAWLDELGVAELSINIEIFSQPLARRVMRWKADLGLDHYLAFLAAAAEVMGAPRVRSMLLVGVEPMDQTLAGVRAIAERGCVPVLSPFRPDPATPMSTTRPPTADFMLETYLRARDIAASYDVPLGPSCVPCTHNTLTLAATGSGDAHGRHGHPHVI
ncbi:MAG: hypothetical protein QOE45_268 [Frankiaceae bacterium]|nr:hypothetical protein [Frankiaceae bacterium]